MKTLFAVLLFFSLQATAADTLHAYYFTTGTYSGTTRQYSDYTEQKTDIPVLFLQNKIKVGEGSYYILQQLPAGYENNYKVTRYSCSDNNEKHCTLEVLQGETITLLWILYDKERVIIYYINN